MHPTSSQLLAVILTINIRKCHVTNRQLTGILYNSLTNIREMQTVLNINSLLFVSTELNRNDPRAEFLKVLVLLNANLEA